MKKRKEARLQKRLEDIWRLMYLKVIQQERKLSRRLIRMRSAL